MIQTFDGVATVSRGDVILILYAGESRVHRTRWLFDRIDEFAATQPADVTMMGVLIVPQTAGIPDAATREENRVRLNRLGRRIRRVVTVSLGNDLATALARTVMKALMVLTQNATVHSVTSSTETALRLVERERSALTPSQTLLRGYVTGLYDALKLSQPA